MDEPETSLEQNALIRLSNLISLRNTQQLTSIIATHDPIVLDSCEWVLFLKNVSFKCSLSFNLSQLKNH